MKYVIVWHPGRGHCMYAAMNDGHLTWTCAEKNATEFRRLEASRLLSGLSGRNRITCYKVWQ